MTELAKVAPDVLLDLDSQLCFALYSASRRVLRGYNELLEKFDLTYTQYVVLLVLWEWERCQHPRPTVKALGERLDLENGTLTPLLRRLVHKGLLTRERSAVDEREVFVKLTPAGRDLKQRIVEVPLSMLAICPLSLEELGALREQLKRLRVETA